MADWLIDRQDSKAHSENKSLSSEQLTWGINELQGLRHGHERRRTILHVRDMPSVYRLFVWRGARVGRASDRKQTLISQDPNPNWARRGPQYRVENAIHGSRQGE